MTTLTCPNCHTLLEVKAIGPAPSERSKYEGTHMLAGPTERDEASLKAYWVVDALVEDLVREGRETITSSEVMERYDEARVEKGAPRLSPRGLARALKACGCANWRNAAVRGFRIPDESKLDKSTMGKYPHVPHVKGRSSYQDSLAFHSISRYVDGRPATDASEIELAEDEPWKPVTDASQLTAEQRAALPFDIE